MIRLLPWVVFFFLALIARERRSMHMHATLAAAIRDDREAFQDHFRLINKWSSISNILIFLATISSLIALIFMVFVDH